MKTVVLLIAAILAATLPDLTAQNEKKPLTLEDVLTYSHYRYYPRGVQWLPGGRAFSHIVTDYQDFTSRLVVVDAGSGKAETRLTSEDLKIPSPGGKPETLTMSACRWLPDGRGIILSARGDIWRFDFTRNALERLTETAAYEAEIDISPDGRRLAFVRQNDLYVLDLAGGEETRLTRDGSETVLNGKFDWLYQEELIGRGNFRAYYWSPTSDALAYLQFDESGVPRYPLIDWSDKNGRVEMMPYPKAGDPNSRVRLGVVSLEKPSTVWIDDNFETDAYFPRVYWTPDGKEVAYIRLDRPQHEAAFIFADPGGGRKRAVITETDPHWINVGDYVYFLAGRPLFIRGSERDGYNHLYLYDYNGRLQRRLTAGDWYVDRLEGVNENDGAVYFTGTEKDIRERHLYRVGLWDGKPERLTRAAGTHRIKMGPGAGFYLDYLQNSSVSLVVTVHDSAGNLRHTLVTDDSGFRETHILSPPEFITFQGDNGLSYEALLIKPPDFDPRKRYPVLIHTYGGPHVQLVRDRGMGANGLWHQLLAGEGIIIFSMDNRGASGRGHAWETPIHRRMGEVELADQLRGVAYLRGLPYVDSRRIAMWGWSYGAYMTLYALTHSQAFCAGIAVAPISDWRYYDTAYTERYMDTPADNPEGYENSSPAAAAENLHGRLLLIHGMSDKNVHVRHTMAMVDALIDGGKQFDLMLYPGQSHGIYSPRDRRHLYTLMTRFLRTNLLQPADP